MMKAEYKKDLTHSYMLFSDSDCPAENTGQAESSYQIKTLLANRIDGLLPMSVWHIDDQSGYRYEITGLQSFAAYCESVSFGPPELKRVYAGLLDSLRRFEDYLLDPVHLLMDPEYLYIEWRTGKLFLPYLPSYSRPLPEKIRELTEYLLAKAELKDNGSVLLLCSILQELKNGDAQLSDIQRCLGGTMSAGDGAINSGSSPILSGSGVMPAGNSSMPAGGGRLSGGSDSMSSGRGLLSAGSDVRAASSEVPAEGGRTYAQYGAIHAGNNAIPTENGAKSAGNGVMYAGEESMAASKGDARSGMNVSGQRRDGGKIIRQLLPERYTIILAAFMAAAAAIVWGALQLQTTFIFSTAETAGCAALGAALIFLCARITGFILDRHDASAESAEKLQYGISYAGSAAEQSPSAAPLDAASAESSLCSQNSSTSDSYWYEYDGARLREPNPFTDPFPYPAAPRASAIEEPQSRLDQWIDEGQETLIHSRFNGWAQGAAHPEAPEDDFGQTVLLSDFAGGGIPASLTPAASDSGLPPFILEKRDLLFGQKKTMADRVIPDRSVSRLHARITYRDGTYFIADMGSKNGTTVNGSPVVGREEVPLLDGARIRFAGCEYIFHDGV